MTIESDKIVLTADDLDGYLSQFDKKYIEELNTLYKPAFSIYKNIASSDNVELREELIAIYNSIGKKIQDIIAEYKTINVYSFQVPKINQSEVSRLIAKLRDYRTDQYEFLYYIQRAYELLFNFAFHRSEKKNYLIVQTPVDRPVQNYAVHKIPDVDDQIENTVMCVMLRGSLLPSMIMSKEIQEYSSQNYVTPFALFRIRRDETAVESNMRYLLDLQSSYFDIETLDGKDLVFADPMNATGGSLVTIMKYLNQKGIRPRSVLFFNILSTVKGSLRIIRAIENAEIFTLWMDPMLTEEAFISPGLGDLGDRLNGQDKKGSLRNIIQLIADYGSGITELYRAQVRAIEHTVLGEM